MAPSLAAPLPADPFHDDLRAARARCRAALGRLLERFRPLLYHIANDELNPALRAKTGASDLVQKSVAEAFQGFHAFLGDSPKEIKAWLRRILRRNIADEISHHQKAKRDVRREESLDAAPAEPAASKRPDASPLQKMVTDENLQELRRAIERLPDDHRHVMKLHHQQGLSFAQIGADLNRSPDAVRKLWERAVKTLRRELGGDHE